MILPRGRADFVRQVAIWFGWALAYQVARGLTRRDAGTALANARAVLDLERDAGLAFELRLQQAVRHVDAAITAVNVTYWLSQFVVVGLALLWIYLRRTEWFLLVRDTVIVTNAVGLAVYVLMPTAPPRLLAGEGFVDTLQGEHMLNHGSGIVELAENPYAAMPSLHTADAVIAAVALVLLVRRRWPKVVWACWPAWVAFSLVVSGNHFWIDVVAGAVLVALTAPAVYRLERRLGRVPAPG